ncbi:odorant receptor 94b-like [Xylocopa sonorina]|uniref:odorant receptor 94b-like n=1 Tax=Xylocopa sonorina TaxID=1818115 RepID=UPI00403AD7DC
MNRAHIGGGCWLPPSWTSPIKKLLYNLFTLIVWLIVHTHVTAQILDIIINVENQDDFSDNIYITPTILIGGFKMTILVIYRKGILSLIDDLHTKPFITVTEEEVRIQRRFNRIIERNAIVYLVLVLACVMWISVRSFFTDFTDRKLTLRAWLPYDYSKQWSYTFTYVYQMITSMSTCLMNVGCDSLFSGFLIHIYGQFEILEERLKNVEQGQIHLAKQCAKHHYQIYKYAKRVNREFSVIMFSQFCVSSFTVCFNFYRMSQVTMISLMVETVLYAACMLTEILYYCWYSNEVKLKSLELSDVIFRSDWTSWDTRATKILLTIMNRATKPIEFTSIYLVSLNLDSFMALMKTSYSMFNLLQQTKYA